jgi:hypothetical protein
MHIFQLVHPDLPGAFPALRTLDAFPGNLPLQVSSFIGRARELKQTAAALGEARVVTLIGVGLCRTFGGDGSCQPSRIR